MVGLCVPLSVCLLVTFVSTAKKAETIEMLAVRRADCGRLREPYIIWGFGSPNEKGQFWELFSH